MNIERRFKSVKIDLSLLIGLLIIILVATISILAYRNSSKSLTEIYLSQMDSTGSIISDVVANFYDTQISKTTIVSQDNRIVDALETGEYYEAISFIKNFTAADPSISSIVVAKINGDWPIIFDSRNGETVGRSIKNDTPGAVESTLAKKAGIDDPFISPISGNPMISFSAPVLSSDSLIGVVIVSVDLEVMTNLVVDQVKIGKTGYPVIFTLDGIAIAHPEKNYNLKLDLKDYDWGKLMLDADDGQFIDYDFEGREKIGVVFHNEEFNYMTTITMFYSEIQEISLPIAVLLIIVGLIGIAVTIILIVYFMWFRLRPLTKIVSATNLISKGQLDITMERSKRKTMDETDMLIDAFIPMLESLNYKARIVDKIASGDITEDVTIASEQDTLGRSLVKMSRSLNKILGHVNLSVEQVNIGADQVAQASQSLSQGATESASSLEEISASITQINSQSRQNAEHAVEANSLANKASSDAENGNKQMSNLAEAMGKINTSSDQIKKIVKVIDDIAFQTNLLALNANVEAARAGKYGKGFAVVADEVRNLAVRSAEAVKETTEMVDDSIRNIEEGNNAVEATARQLESIMNGSSKVADYLEEIAAASKEQAEAINQITQGLEQIDQVTQSNTASAEESASAAEELASQSNQLKSMVSTFRLKNPLSYSENGQRQLSGKIGENEYSTSNDAVYTSREDIISAAPASIINLDEDDFDRF